MRELKKTKPDMGVTLLIFYTVYNTDENTNF